MVGCDLIFLEIDFLFSARSNLIRFISSSTSLNFILFDNLMKFALLSLIINVSIENHYPKLDVILLREYIFSDHLG